MRIEEYLENMPYPGRMIFGGTLRSGKAFALYAITGRSERSRNRVIKSKDGSVYTELYDKSGDSDDLIVYSLKREDSLYRVIANGNHADSVFGAVRSGKKLIEAIGDLSYENDPLSTPRIVLSENLASGEYELGIVRAGESGKEERICWSYGNTPGFGHIISTYSGSDEEPHAFFSDPEVIAIGDSASDFIDSFFSSLNSNYRVSVYACFEGAERIINVLG